MGAGGNPYSNAVPMPPPIGGPTKVPNIGVNASRPGVVQSENVALDVYGRRYDPTVPVFFPTGTRFVYDRLKWGPESLIDIHTLVAMADDLGWTWGQREHGMPPQWWLDANNLPVTVQPGYGPDAEYDGGEVVPPSGNRPDWWIDFTGWFSGHGSGGRFERASPAYYTNRDGQFVEAGVNVPRRDFEVRDDGTVYPKGLLIEGEATNRLLHNTTMGQAPWFSARLTAAPHSDTFRGQPVVRVTETADTGTHQVSHTDDAEVGSVICIMAKLAPDGDARSFSVYHNNNNNEGRVAFHLETGTTGSVGTAVTAYGMDPVEDGWFRCWVACGTDTTATDKRAVFRLHLGGGTAASYAGDGVSGLLFALPYRIDSTTPQSPIITGAAPVTRAADFPTADLAEMIPQGLPSGGSFYAEFESRDIASRPTNTIVMGSSENCVIGYSDGVDPKLLAKGGSVVPYSTLADNTHHKFSLSEDKVYSLTTVMDGVVGLEDAQTYLVNNIGEDLLIGHNGTTNHLNGWIKRIQIHLDPLTTDDMVAMTAPEGSP